MKSKSLRTAALLALGLAAISPSPAAAKTNAQTIQKEQIAIKQSSTKEVIKQMAGGFHVVGHREGIPPHIYSQHYVKKGSHKRTNKK